MCGEVCERRGPEIGGCDCQGVVFQFSDSIGATEPKKPELAEIGNEDQPVLAEIANGLRLGSESIEAVVGWLDFYDATLGVLEPVGSTLRRWPLGWGKNPPSGMPAPLLRSWVENRTTGLRV